MQVLLRLMASQQPEGRTNDFDHAVDLMVRFMMPRGDGKDPVAEQVATALATAMGESAANVNVWRDDEWS